MFDVLVVGGGPAGLATAIGCRRRGLSVCLLDRGAVPRDKACGEGLMPTAVAALERLGIDARALGRPFLGIRYFDGDLRAEGRFLDATGVGVRRTRLHQALAATATDSGVDCRWNCRVGAFGPVPSPDQVVALQTSDGPVEGRYIVGADGLLSATRQWAELAAAPASRRRFGVRRHYRIPPWSEWVEVYWAKASEAYVTPVGDDEVGVALLWSGRKASFDSLLAEVPTLRARLIGVESTSRDRGAGPFEQRVRSVIRGPIALVGDAAGYVDALTGEGVGLALRQAEALASALAADRLAIYAMAHQRLGRRVRLVTRSLVALDRLPVARRGMIHLLSRCPTLFSHVLGWMARS